MKLIGNEAVRLRALGITSNCTYALTPQQLKLLQAVAKQGMKGITISKLTEIVPLNVQQVHYTVVTLISK